MPINSCKNSLNYTYIKPILIYATCTSREPIVLNGTKLCLKVSLLTFWDVIVFTKRRTTKANSKANIKFGLHIVVSFFQVRLS